MMRKLHRTYTVPASFDAEIDEAMRGFDSALARVPGERYPVAANEAAWPALRIAARGALPAGELAPRQLDAALRRRVENEAEAERRRDLALRGDRSRTRRRSTASRPGRPRRSRGSSAATREARYSVNGAPLEVAEFLARGAVRANA